MPNKSWSDNREPNLLAMLDDSVMQAIMLRDYVTRQDVLALVAQFRSPERGEELQPLRARLNTLPIPSMNASPRELVAEGA